MTTNERRPIHAYLSPKAHEQWHDTCATQRVSVSVMLEAMGPALADILDALPDLVTEAGRIETERRRRNR